MKKNPTLSAVISIALAAYFIYKGIQKLSIPDLATFGIIEIVGGVVLVILSIYQLFKSQKDDDE